MFLVFALHDLILILITLANEACPITELSLCCVLDCDDGCPNCCGKGSPSHMKGRRWTNKNHMRKQKFREVSNLPKATHLVTGKGGMWNQAAHLQNNSVSARICMTPLQAAHASPTPSGCYGLIDRGIFIFASFWF